LMELCDAFFRLKPPTRLRLRAEALSGTLEALASGQAALALGAVLAAGTAGGLHREPLGSLRFVFAVAPHHALARAPRRLTAGAVRPHRAVAAAGSIQRGDGLTLALFSGQDVSTFAGMPAKLAAQLRGLGVGFLPTWLAQPYIATGRLVVKGVQ